MTTTEDIYEQAALWHQGQHRDDFDWDGFTRWLAANPEHRACYNEIALPDEEIDRLRPALLPRAVKTKAHANGCAGASSRAPLQPRPWPSYHCRFCAFDAPTASPRRESDTCAGSTLVANVDNAHHVRLTGTAFFDVRHDPASPFTVEGSRLPRQRCRYPVRCLSGERYSQGWRFRPGLCPGKALSQTQGRGVVEITARRPRPSGAGGRAGSCITARRSGWSSPMCRATQVGGWRSTATRANRRFSGVITIEAGVSAYRRAQAVDGVGCEWKEALCVSSVVLAASVAGPAAAQDRVLSIDVPAGTLETMLAALATQTKTSFALDAPLPQRRAIALRGRMTIDAALRATLGRHRPLGPPRRTGDLFGYRLPPAARTPARQPPAQIQPFHRTSSSPPGRCASCFRKCRDRSRSMYWMEAPPRPRTLARRRWRPGSGIDCYEWRAVRADCSCGA
ncbi:unnamed protein product [Acanthosepion pharaonis]|uniref:DUF4880 domain-containing protein n=1 Tax=Acanthosepion pharaonis TaxID=158019 RepID=A0A812DSK3_ACAPH|nr:unnamed protein product [Sepia pharaonis]